MIRQEIEKMKQQLEAEYRQAIEVAEKEYSRKLEALETVLSMAAPQANGMENLSRYQTSPDKLQRTQYKRTQSEVVSQLLQTIDGEISQPQVISLLKSNYPELAKKITPPRVSTLLRGLEEQGVLKLVRRGAGSRPSAYCLANGAGH